MMLKNTFIHIPGIGIKIEERLWDSGILDWDSFKEPFQINLSHKKLESIERYLQESKEHLESNNPKYFESLLPASQHWRMFSDFRDSTVYLDIETTGLNMWGFEITTISLYDGESIFCYVKDQNLEDFEKDINKYKVIVTYNGKSFDIPFIERYFGINLPQAHIDLRYILASLGFSGGLKGCEKQLWIDRGNLEDVDGYFAVLLWYDYKQNKNQKALETLLAYNIQDTVNLETLMVQAHNMKLRDFPFLKIHQLPVPKQPDISFEADRKTIDRIKGQIYSGTDVY
ncbi:ribonuclease H-like domain-containing protein [Thermodesulfobacteriota bacterium]